MGLINLQTDLKSLQYGHDRFAGGNSNQPYIQTPIEDDPSQQIQTPDFLWRGGLKAPTNAIQDVSRLTKWFFDKTSPKGLLFTANQQLLSRTAVRTQASGLLLNEGAYTPLNTLMQAGFGYLGGHTPKQGLIPGVGPKTYIGAKNKIIGSQISKNRLVKLTETKITPITSDVNVRKYGGGPGSILGVGKTTIKFAQNFEGAPLRTGVNSLAYARITNNLSDSPDPNTIPTFNTTLTDQRSFINIPTEGTFGNWGDPGIRDFRKLLLNSFTPGNPFPTVEQDVQSTTIMSLAPSYNVKDKKTIDGNSTSRVKYVSPGQRGNIISYQKGKILPGQNTPIPIDRINAEPIYQSNRPKEKQLNDLIQFRIGSIDNNNPNVKTYIHFRAYIDSFSDKYGAKWNSTNYMGRGEDFYSYGGFNRSISLSFTVAAQSKPELMNQYRKLNFLASNLAPVYSSAGYMGGPLVTLTMGGWLYEQPGFITGLTLNVPKESPWEIGIGDKGDGDPALRELPHIVQVSGFGFTPIHNFKPQKQVNTYNPDSPGNVESYGKEHYISLADGGDTKGDMGYMPEAMSGRLIND